MNFARLPIYCIISGPVLYSINYFAKPIPDELYDQYQFGCICIVASGIIELFAETLVFIAQVFCFVKLRVVLDTLHIFVRSILFIVLVLRNPDQAIFAFSIAQVGSTIAFAIGYYAYFIYYIDRSKKVKGDEKRAADISNGEPMTDEKKSESDDSIPFNSIKQMLPGYLNNTVIAYESTFLNLKSTLNYPNGTFLIFFFTFSYFVGRKI